MEKGEVDIDLLRLSAIASDSQLASLPDFREEVPNPAEVLAGQMWRARWDDVVTMVLVDSVIGTSRNLLRVAPVTVGWDLADERAVLLPEIFTSLAVDLSVWPEFATGIAEIVLERWITDIRDFQSIAALEAAADTGELRRGTPNLNRDGRRAHEKSMLGLEMEALRDAAHVLSGSGTLAEIISGAGIAVTALAKIMGVSNQFALGVANGSISLTLSEARALSASVNVSATRLLRANPAAPEGLVSAATVRSVRSRLDRLSSQTGEPQSSCFDQFTQGALALAARQEGQESDWAARISLYFEIRLGNGYVS